MLHHGEDIVHMTYLCLVQFEQFACDLRQVKTDCHEIAEILLNVVLNTINQTSFSKYDIF